ncbi:MAG TPA: radical SAM protein [Methanobacterium sp.]|nr:radical SAM protein [Methanobacterium sp.]
MITNKSPNLDILLVGFEEEENLGIRYIAAFLDKNGITVAIEPYNPLAKEELLNKILKETPDIIAFSLIFQRMLPDFNNLIKYLRENKVKAHFTIGGHFPTIKFKETLNFIPELDSIIRHEGEKTLLELYNHLENPERWPSIKGLAYIDINGKLIVTETRALIHDLDSLPFPVRSLNFQDEIGTCSLIASRGCYHNCSFCSVREFYKTPKGFNKRLRSPQNVVKEMEYLFKQNIRIFMFKDDDLGTRSQRDKIWIKNFVEELKKKDLGDKILWRISCRVDQIKYNLLNDLKGVGLEFVYMGIESGSNKSLKTLNKQYSVEDIYTALDVLEKLKMNFEYGFMLFEPSSTIETIEESINFLEILCKNGRVPVHFTKMIPYAGTPIELKLKKEGRLKGDLSSPDYDYPDPKLGLLEVFFNQAFHKSLFNENGIVNMLQLAKYNSIITSKFFPEQYDPNYLKSVQTLTNRFNESAIETMLKTIKFMADKDYKDILLYWDLLNILLNQELNVQEQIEEEIKKLLFLPSDSPFQ